MHYFWFGRKVAIQEPRSPIVHRRQGQGGVPMKGFRTLVVEDEVLLQRVIEDAARLIGLPCEVVRTGREALERLREHTYDLLIQDVRLPDMSGAAVVQVARQIDPNLPIILITAYKADIEVHEALQHGVAVLFKPFDIDTLLTSMRHLVLKRHAMPLSHAVVQMPQEVAPVAESRLYHMGIAMPPVGGLVSLDIEGRRLIGRVHAGDELLFSVETPPDPEIIPGRVQVELTGCDALYRFSTHLIEHGHAEESDWWLLRRPRQIKRVQRRREPRLPAQGHGVLSVVGSLPRTVEGTLVDISGTVSRSNCQ